MNWIGKYIRAHCRKGNPKCDGCVRKCPGKEKIAEACHISADLVGIVRAGGITHPRIADSIAYFTGASAAQRDSIVDLQHRGTWKPGQRPKRRVKIIDANEKKPQIRHVVAVVAVDALGNEAGRFDSVSEAAERLSTSTSLISARCMRVSKAKHNEFNKFSLTFRYAQEWDMMTPEQRAEDMRQFYDRR